MQTIADCLNEEPPGQPATSIPRDKEARGWEHPTTAWFLTPHQHVKLYKEDRVKYIESVRDGSTKITGEDFPMLAYDETLNDGSVHFVRGLFRGIAPIRVRSLLCSSTHTDGRLSVCKANVVLKCRSPKFRRCRGAESSTGKSAQDR